MTPVEARNSALVRRAAKVFESKGYRTFYCDKKEDISALVLPLLKEGASVTWGGSMTVVECGLADALKRGNFEVWDRAAVPPEQKADVMRKAFFADAYFMSANGISLTGELVNIDGTGNRVAALSYGPKEVFVIAGVNKIEPDLPAAISRARHTAAPVNAARFDINTPCKLTGDCANCACPDSICAQFLVTRFCRPQGRITMIFCAETLGY